MERLTAKPIIEDEFWILQQNNIKIGQIKVLAENDIEVRINGKEYLRYASLKDLRGSGLFTFETIPMPRNDPMDSVHGFPTDCIAHNAVWNVEEGLPLYTQAADSKSWFAAGYYKLNINGSWIIQFCPKLIALQRNEYEGPFKKEPGLNNFHDLFE